MFDGVKGGSVTGSQRSTVEVVDAFPGFGSSGVDGGHEDSILLIQAKRATVKQLVVQGT
jgi:hypothetical protein